MTMVAEKTDTTAYRKGEFSDASDHDTESINGPPQHATLQRKLKNRHIAMIRCVDFHSIPIKCSPSSSIGGVIGTGLFVGTASSLANGGPVGLLLGYLVMGSIVYSVMITLGEMVCPPSSTYGHIPYLHFPRLPSCQYLVVTSGSLSASLTLRSLLPWVGITGITGPSSVSLILPLIFTVADLLLCSAWYLTFCCAFERAF
jgi:hypothetical protein